MSDWNDAIEAAAKVAEAHGDWCMEHFGGEKARTAATISQMILALKRPEAELKNFEGCTVVNNVATGIMVNDNPTSGGPGGS